MLDAGAADCSHCGMRNSDYSQKALTESSSRKAGLTEFGMEVQSVKEVVAYGGPRYTSISLSAALRALVL